MVLKVMELIPILYWNNLYNTSFKKASIPKNINQNHWRFTVLDKDNTNTKVEKWKKISNLARRKKNLFILR